MPWINIPVTRYLVSIGGQYSSQIQFYSESGVIGQAIFENAPVSRARKTPWGSYQIFFDVNVLGPMLDMLRNEKPIIFKYLDHENPEIHRGYIRTTTEPIGEEEHEEP